MRARVPHARSPCDRRGAPSALGGTAASRMPFGVRDRRCRVQCPCGGCRHSVSTSARERPCAFLPGEFAAEAALHTGHFPAQTPPTGCIDSRCHCTAGPPPKACQVEKGQRCRLWNVDRRTFPIHPSGRSLTAKKKNLVPYKKTQNLGPEMELELQLNAVDLQPTAVDLQPTAVGLQLTAVGL